MKNMKLWDGVIVAFKDVHDLISWVAEPNEKYIETTELYCYECFNKLSQSDLEDTKRAYDQVTWCNNGHALPLYSAFCFTCKDMLNILTEYCCENHQTKLAPMTRQGLLGVMATQITEEMTLCPYIVIRTVYYFELTNEDINCLIELGKQHISQFMNTHSGIMLCSLGELS